MNCALSTASRILPLIVLLGASGCDKESSELTTNQIEAAFTVEVDDTDRAKPVTRLGAMLRESDASAVGPQGAVNLSGGDALNVTTDKGNELPLVRAADGRYEGSIPDANATIFTFRLKRAESSSDTVFNLHGPLAFTDSPAGKTYKAGDSVHFAWSNAAKSGSAGFPKPAKLLVSASHYPCGGAAITLAARDDLPFDDTGMLDVTVSQLYRGATPAAGDCVDIRIERRVVLDAASAFDKASSVSGTRADRLQIKIQ